MVLLFVTEFELTKKRWYWTDKGSGLRLIDEAASPTAFSPASPGRKRLPSFFASGCSPEYTCRHPALGMSLGRTISGSFRTIQPVSQVPADRGRQPLHLLQLGVADRDPPLTGYIPIFGHTSGMKTDTSRASKAYRQICRPPS